MISADILGIWNDESGAFLKSDSIFAYSIKLGLIRTRGLVTAADVCFYLIFFFCRQYAHFSLWLENDGLCECIKIVRDDGNDIIFLSRIPKFTRKERNALNRPLPGKSIHIHKFLFFLHLSSLHSRKLLRVHSLLRREIVIAPKNKCSLSFSTAMVPWV